MAKEYMKVIFVGEEDDINRFYSERIKEMFGNDELSVKAVSVAKLSEEEIEQEFKF